MYPFLPAQYYADGYRQFGLYASGSRKGHFDIKRLLNGNHYIFIYLLAWTVYQRKPGLPVVAVQDQGGWFGRTAINEQDDHLAVARIRPVMWTRAIFQRKARGV